MAQIIPFAGGTTLPLPVARVLEAAKGCEAVLILGLDAAGDFYAAASTGEAPVLLWWIEMFKAKLLHGDYASG